jgi:hypothetical protein
MKKLNKTLAIFLAIASTTVLIAGCGTNTDSENNNSGTTNNSQNNTEDKSENNSSIVQPQSITLSKTNLELYVGDTYQLYATVSPASANQNVTWSSVATSCATVNDSGLIQCIASGTTVIKATTTNAIVATCTVTVSQAVGTVSGAVTYKYKVSSSATEYKDSDSVIQLISKNITAFPNTYYLSGSFDCGIYATQTDSDGKYTFTDIPAGDYIMIIKSGHAKQSTQTTSNLLYGNDEEELKDLYGSELYSLLVKLKDVPFSSNSTLTRYDRIVNSLLTYQAYGRSVKVETNKTTTENVIFYAIYN